MTREISIKLSHQCHGKKKKMGGIINIRTTSKENFHALVTRLIVLTSGLTHTFRLLEKSLPVGSVRPEVTPEVVPLSIRSNTSLGARRASPKPNYHTPISDSTLEQR